MFDRNKKGFWPKIAPFAAGGLIGAAFGAVLGSPVSEAFYNAQAEVNGYSARADGGIVFETKNGTEGEKKCLVEAKKFVQALPENFTAPIKDYGVFIRVAEVDFQETPHFRNSKHRVTLYYDRETKSCSSSFSIAHELGHAFDAAKNLPSESKAYRKAVDEALASPELKELFSNPAARAELNAISNGNPDKLIREETFADITACQLVPGTSEPNFLGFCGQPAAAPARAYVAASLKL